MAFTKVQDLDADVTISLGGRNKKTGKDNPKSVEGYYLGGRQVDSAKAKNGKAWLYIFQTAKGNIGVWGKTDLDKKMANVKPGTMTRATHVGFVPTPNGEMYKFGVEIDTDNTIEVAGAPAETESQDGGGYGDAMAEDYNTYGSDSSDDDERDVTEAPEAITANPTANRAAAQAKVAALLSRKSKPA